MLIHKNPCSLGRLANQRWSCYDSINQKRHVHKEILFESHGHIVIVLKFCGNIDFGYAEMEFVQQIETILVWNTFNMPVGKDAITSIVFGHEKKILGAINYLKSLHQSKKHHRQTKTFFLD